MSRRLLGVETEYAVTALDAEGVPVDRSQIVHLLGSMAAAQYAHAPDIRGAGMFLSNGSRFYVDCGFHPELATPECTNPADVVRYVLAGARMLSRLAAQVEQSHVRGGRVSVFRCNVDYGGAGTTWGCHESYLHRAARDVLAEHLIPHLVSRIVFTGAGGFNPRSPGLAFSLSPRVAHIELEVSAESTSTRGIFHTKQEALCGKGYGRLHVLCGDSACSELATWLKVGTTALVVALIEAGVGVGAGVQLRRPVHAMSTVAGDAGCAAPLALRTGGVARALDIQRHYLGTAESRLGDPFMPSWAGDVCRAWRATLNRIEQDRPSLATQLDWAIKAPLYERHARRRGFSWDDISRWTSALTPPRREGQDQWLDLPDANAPPLPPLAARLREHGLSRADLPAFQAMRRELFEIDTRFGELGDRGVFAALERTGALTHHVTGVDRLEEAITEPPAEGRAAVRGAVIARASGRSPCVCDWPALWDVNGRRVLDLSDPFEIEERWTAMAAGPDDAVVSGPISRLTQAMQYWLR